MCGGTRAHREFPDLSECRRLLWHSHPWCGAVGAGRSWAVSRAVRGWLRAVFALGQGPFSGTVFLWLGLFSG